MIATTGSCWALIRVSLLLSLAGPAWAIGEYCPDYHREDKVYAAQVKADLKRRARAQGVPERLMYLYDQLGDCPSCLDVEFGDALMPSLYIRYSPDARISRGGLRNIRNRKTSWNADEEYAARQGMRDGYIEAFYILIQATKCECCTASTQEEFDDWWNGELDPEDEPGWNEDLEFDSSVTDAHENRDELGPDPPDLTEIDDKDRYPDELPIPPLDIPPPVRPMTTGCGACEPLVDEFNDLAVRINQQSRVVARHRQMLQIGEIAFRFIARELRAHEQLAQNETWEAEQNRLLDRYGDLVASSQEDQARLDQQIAVLRELEAQLAGLRLSIHDCESRCRLLDSQAPPSTDPPPPAAGPEPPLPPFVRIATGTCPLCTGPLERRNNLARDMNELVQGMIDAGGVNANSMAAWETLRTGLEAANAALRDCAAVCARPIEENPTVLPVAEDLPVAEEPPVTEDLTRTEPCPPCLAYQREVDLLTEKIRSLSRQLERLRVEADPSSTQSRRRREGERLMALLQETSASLRTASIRLRHCQATQCNMADYRPNPATATRLHVFLGPDAFARSKGYFFVTTTCEACRNRANAINAWVLNAHEEWLTPQFLSAMHSSTNRYRLLEFLMDLEAQTADLKECERQSCPATYDAETYAAYLTDDMAPRACLDNEQTKAIGTAEDLPESCRGSLLEQRVLQCEDSNCAGTADVAVAGIAAAACRGDGVPIAEFIAELDLERWFSYPASACNLPSSPVPGVEIGVMRNSQDLLSGDPEDPFYLSSGAMEPALPDQWGTRRIGSYDALADDERYPVTAARTIVAVIDSGVDIHHPDLRGMLWVNPGELPGNGFDDDGNGFVDDRHGWNFVQNNADVQDNNGHGTMVAGIIAAEPYNGIGIAGVNPWAKIMAIKVTNFRGNGNSVDIAAAITYAVNEGARVINVSLGGGGFSEVEQAAVRYAESKGVLVVVAAGNQGTDASRFWPAGLGNVVTVAATEPGDARASYSNWGSPVDVAAPGSSMLSLRARGTDLMYFVEDDYPYGRNIVGQDRLLYYASGTSFAAPLVSGAASLVLSMHAGLGADEVRRMLLHAATDIETPGVDALTGYGLVDARAALAADPAYFTEAAITGVRSVRREGALLVEVIGTADADRFASAQIDFGEGNAPEDWTTVGEPMLTPVRDGVLAGIDAARLRGSPQWTLRVVTRHEDGSRREARFALTLQ